MRAFVAEQHAYLQSVKASNDELILRLEEANKLAQELSDRKKQLKAAMFNDKLASFIAFPSIGVESLGELAFTGIQLPFKQLDMASTDLKPIDIRAEFDFVLPLEHGQRIVTFKRYTKKDRYRDATQMSCFDRLGRLLGFEDLEYDVMRGHAARSGPNQFLVCYDFDSPKLSVYNSSLHRLRIVECINFEDICCNSKFVCGLCNYADDDYYFNFASDEQEAKPLSQRIQVLHLDSLSEAFGLRVPKKYTVKRIMADEHHLVAMVYPNSKSSTLWFMTIYDLATCDERARSVNRNSRQETESYLVLAERHVELSIESVSLYGVFLLDGWIVVRPDNEKELFWFDKNGKQSETRTEWDSKKLKDMYSFGSGLLLAQHDRKLLLKG